MSKTPVSALQEHLATQNLELPTYVLVAQTSGTHMPSFTIRVSCLGKSAEGTATNKKEAKHNAAKQMLRMLSITNSICGSDLPKLNNNVSTATPDLLSGTPVTPDNGFVNFVGKLAEHCLAFKLKPPEYLERNACGPPHMRVFTITCSIGNMSIDGTANTKKQAKHIAAQNMYQKLVTTTTSKTVNHLTDSDIRDNSRIDVDRLMEEINCSDMKIDDLWMPIEQSREKAIKLFPQLRSQGPMKTNRNVSIEGFHSALKNSISSGKRGTARKQLSTSTMDKEGQLMEVLRILNLAAEFKTMVCNPNAYIVSCALNSEPTIREMAIGKTVHEAKEQAIHKMINSIDLLLI